MLRWESSLVKEYQQLGPLGHGGYAQVVKARKILTNQLFALKRIKKYKLQDEKIKKQIDLQVSLMKSMDHERIIKLYDTFDDGEHINMVLELAEGGSLYDKLQNDGRFSENRVVKHMRDIVEAVDYLHGQEHPIIHRDLKPQNILMDSTGRCKVTDFGSANRIDLPGGKRGTFAGTQIYMAPQIIANLPYTQKVDMWNIGIMIFELLTGDNPFSCHSGDLGLAIAQWDPRFPDYFPTLARDVVRRLLEKDPEKRPSIKQLKAHLWLTSYFPDPVSSITHYRPSALTNNREQSHCLKQVKEELAKLQQGWREKDAEQARIKEIKKLIRQKKESIQRRTLAATFNSNQYFRLSDLLVQLKAKFKQNEQKLFQHNLHRLKCSREQAKEQKDMQDQIKEYEQKIQQLRKYEPKYMQRLKASFDSAKAKLKDIERSLEALPERLKHQLLYFREPNVQVGEGNQPLKELEEHQLVSLQTMIMTTDILRSKKQALIQLKNNLRKRKPIFQEDEEYS